MFTAIIVDDHDPSRCLTAELLRKHFPEIEIKAQTSTLLDGINALERHHANLVFLDMALPDGKGYELFDIPFSFPFKVIFITAFPEYAYPAINYSPAGYILKPMDPCQFVSVVRKALLQPLGVQWFQEAEAPRLETLRSDKMVIRTTESIYIIPKELIIRCEACRNYTTIYQQGEKGILASQTLKEFEDLLPYPQFLRVHQSHLVNTSFIKLISKTDCCLLLSDNSRVPIAYRKREQLMKYVKSITN